MSSSEFNIGPTGPVSPSPTSRALTRVTPVSPQPVVDDSGFPLKRSGLDIRELFRAADQVVVRSRTPAVALELGLEQARGSMVRNQPADALATLDEVWSGARHTETGWYLRGGSLALLGLPGEASRVVTEGLRTNPQSAAINFLQSLARLTLGDVAAAQLALDAAAANSEPDPLLLVQHALIAAQRGNIAEAENLLKRAAGRWPEHPALSYGLSMMRELLRNGSRDNDRTPAFSRTPISVNAQIDEFAEHETSEPVYVPDERERGQPEPSILNGSVNERREVGNAIREDSRDVAADALRELGSQLVTGTKRQSLVDARALLVSLSAGGTLATSIPASRAHTTRAVLGAFIDALTGGATTGLGWDAESVDGQWQRSASETGPAHREFDNTADHDVLINTVRVLTAALRDGHVAEASAQLRRVRGSIAEPAMILLQSIVDGAEGEGNESLQRPSSIDQSDAYIRNGAPGHILLAPLRLGLALLPDSELETHRSRTPSDPNGAVSYASTIAGVSVSDTNGEVRSASGTPGAFIAAAGLVALAVVAFSASLPLAGIACAGGGVWLALRKGPRD